MKNNKNLKGRRPNQETIFKQFFKLVNKEERRIKKEIKEQNKTNKLIKKTLDNNMKKVLKEYNKLNKPKRTLKKKNIINNDDNNNIIKQRKTRTKKININDNVNNIDENINNVNEEINYNEVINYLNDKLEENNNNNDDVIINNTEKEINNNEDEEIKNNVDEELNNNNDDVNNNIIDNNEFEEININNTLVENKDILNKYYYNINEALEACKNTNYYLFYQDFKKFIIYDDVNIIEDDLNLYEVLNNKYSFEQRYYKLYFDIESDDEEFLKIYDTNEKKYKIIDNFISIIDYYLNSFYNKYNENSDNKRKIIKDIINNVMVLKSENQNKKFSFHLIFNKITFRNNIIMYDEFIKPLLEFDKYKLLMLKFNNIKMALPDLNVYKNNQYMRCYNQSKKLKDNKLILCNNNIDENNLDIHDSYIMTINKGLIHNDDEYNDINYNNINNDNEIFEDNEDNKNLINNILMGLDVKRATEFNDWFKILNTVRKLNINYLDIFINFSKRTTKNNYSKKDILNRWKRFKDNNKTPSIYYLFKLLKEDNIELYDKLKKEFDNKKVLKLINNYYDISDNNINTIILKPDELINNMYLPENLLLNYDNEKIIFVKSHLGTGKTTRYHEFIKYHADRGKSILILTPRILYAVSVREEIKIKTGVEFTLYNEKVEKGLDDNYLIIQVESLNRIIKNNYNIILIDEVEGVNERFNNEEGNLKCHNGNYIKNFNTFEILINNADKIIAADAFLNNTSIELIKNLRPEDKPLLIVNNAQPYNRTAQEFEHEDNLIMDSIEVLKQGKKIIIFNGSKKDCKYYEYKYKEYFKETKKIVIHHADKNINEDKEILKDVNTNWLSDVLIYNSKITVGINMDVEHFDQIYIISSNHVLVRDIFQASLRVRKIKDNLLKYCLLADDIPYYYHFSKNSLNENINNKVELIKKYSLVDNIYNDVPEWLKNNLINLDYERLLNINYFRTKFNYYLSLCGYNIIEKNTEKAKISGFELKDNNYMTILEAKNQIYSVDNLLKDNEFINICKNRIKLYNKDINKNDINNNIIIEEINNNNISSSFINNYIRDKITDEQKKGLLGGHVKDYIKELIDMTDKIYNINSMTLEEFNYKKEILKEGYTKEIIYNDEEIEKINIINNEILECDKKLHENFKNSNKTELKEKYNKDEIKEFRRLGDERKKIIEEKTILNNELEQIKNNNELKNRDYYINKHFKFLKENGNDVEIKLNELYDIYLNKFKNIQFKNIKLYDSFTSQEAQEYYNKKLNDNIHLITPIGQQLEIINNISNIINEPLKIAIEKYKKDKEELNEKIEMKKFLIQYYKDKGFKEKVNEKNLKEVLDKNHNTDMDENNDNVYINYKIYNNVALIDYNTYEKLITYVKDNDKIINTAFKNLRYSKGMGQHRNLLNAVLGFWCGGNIQYIKKYDGKTPKEDKILKYECPFNGVILKQYNKQTEKINNKISLFLDDGINNIDN